MFSSAATSTTQARKVPYSGAHVFTWRAGAVTSYAPAAKLAWFNATELGPELGGVEARASLGLACSAMFRSTPGSGPEVSAFVLARVGARRRADDTSEMPVQLALVVQPDARRNFAWFHARCEKLLRAHDAQPREVGMRR